MIVYQKNGRIWYSIKKEVLKARNKGDRIYYDAFEKAYYIVKPNKESFWNF